MSAPHTSRPEGKLHAVVLVFRNEAGEEERWTLNPEVVDALIFGSEVMERQFPDSRPEPMDDESQGDALLQGEYLKEVPDPVCFHYRRPYCQIRCLT